MAERQFGPYRLVKQVAVGGMAEIHLAKTKGIAGFEKYVAVKMIHPNFAEDEQFIQMLVDEAKIAVQLTHGNIAQTFDLGRVGSTYYITMEYIDGADLYKLLRKGSEVDLELPLDICAFVAKEIAQALDYAHRKKDVTGKPLGIVHRDVSPQNVLVSYAGEVKLVDFGIAKATSKAKQTAIGVIKGKYYYMSPEQAWGDPIDYRSDIFSAGIVLYEMITGQMLYLEEDLHKLLDMARKADIAPPSSLRPGVPPQLEKIVMHALAKVPGERYQSAGDFATDLERFLHAYSPVFTAAKLSSVLRNVIGDPPQIPVEAAPAELRDGPTSTQPLPLDAVVHNKEEIRDENSVIFRMRDLDATGNAPARVKAAVAPSAPKPPPPNPAGAPAAPRPGRSTQSAPVAPIPSVGRAQTAKIPSIAKPAPAPAPAPAAAPAPAPAPAKPRPPNRTRQLDEETRELSAAPADPNHEVSGLLTLEPSRTTTAPLKKAKDAPPAAPAKPPAGWTDAIDTHGGDDELENIGERTMITKSPAADDGDEAGYGGSPDATMITRAPRGAPSDDSEDQTHPGLDADGADEAAIEAGIAAALQQDRKASAAARAGDSDDDMDMPTMSRMDSVVDEDMPTMSRDFRDPAPPAKPRTSPKAPAPPALAAKIHSPAVSELRKPRASRRTPPGGVPAQGNVLQAIVGAQISEPMPTPRPFAAPAAPPPTPPAPPPAPPPPAPPPPAFAPPPEYPAPYGALPGMPPPHPGTYPPAPGYPPQGSYPPGALGYGEGMSPYGADPNTPHGAYPSPGALYAYQPFGAAPTPPTLTGQLRLTEGDEIPAHLKIRSGSRGLKIALITLLLLGAAAVAAFFILRATRDVTPTVGAIRVESSPPGAEITLDGQRLTDVTPFTIAGVPVGTRHDIKVSLAHYTSDAQTVDVPKAGGEAQVTAILKPITGTLKINSIPAGAEIRIDGINRGNTPKTITDVDMRAARHLELRLKDYQVYPVDLTWPENGEIDLDATLKK